VRSTAPQGGQFKVDLINNGDISQVFNIYTVDSFAKIPALTGSTVTVEFITPSLPTLFKRGNVDGDPIGELDLTDAIYLLGYLFTGKSAPACLDAADADDSGELDLSDAVYLLVFLFGGGPAPLTPFPNYGLDPTADSMPDCF
jgi:hypothetical protein